MRVVPFVGGSIVVALVSLAGCGNDGGGEPTATGGGQASELAERAGLDATEAARAICDAWEADSGDSASINEYVHDLFLPLDAVNSSNPPGYSTEDIDAAVTGACAVHPDDPDALLAAVRADLGITATELEAQVAAACARYEVQRERIAAGDWSGEDLADLLRQVAAGRGVELAELRSAIQGVCAG